MFDFKPIQIAVKRYSRNWVGQFVTLRFRQCQSARAMLSEKVRIKSINVYLTNKRTCLLVTGAWCKLLTHGFVKMNSNEIFLIRFRLKHMTNIRMMTTALICLCVPLFASNISKKIWISMDCSVKDILIFFWRHKASIECKLTVTMTTPCITGPESASG